MGAISPEWLDYGALGLLLAVLVAIGIYIREVHHFLEKLIHTNTERMNEIVRVASVREDAHIATWKELMQSSLKAQERSEYALRELCDALKVHDARMVERTQDLKERLRQNPSQSGAGHA